MAEKGEDNLGEQCAQLVKVGLLGDTVNNDPTAPIKMRESNSKESSKGNLGSGSATVPARQVAPSGIVISGSLAVLCIGSFVLVILGVAFFVYRNYYGPGRIGGGGRRNPYTLVMKQGDV